MALSLICTFHKSLGHAIRFLATDLSQEVSLQTTMKSSCRCLFNHLGLPTLQNSTQFSNYNSLIESSYKRLSLLAGRGPHRKHLLGMRISNFLA
jgi:hypothetical protein